MEHLAPTVEFKIDENCRTFGTLAISLLRNPDQKYNTEYKVNGSTISIVPFKVDFDAARTWFTNKSTTLDPISLHPILMLIQNAIKTWDALLYHKNTVSKELGLPPWAEILAGGKTITGKLKKSRTLAVGPLVHIHALKKLNMTTPIPQNKLNPVIIGKRQDTSTL